MTRLKPHIINSKWDIPMHTHCNEKPSLQDKTLTATDCKNKNHWTWMIKCLFFLYINLRILIYVIFRWLWGSLAPPTAPSALDVPCPGPGKQLTNCNKECPLNQTERIKGFNSRILAALLLPKPDLQHVFQAFRRQDITSLARLPIWLFQLVSIATVKAGLMTEMVEAYPYIISY